MRMFVLLLGAIMLAGCASAPAQYVDQDAVAKAERSANLGWAQIRWVNYPTTTKKPDAAASQ